jgi:hypothetical protein
VGFVVDKVSLGQVFSEYFDFPCQSLFQQLLHNHPHLSSGAGKIDQVQVAIKKNKNHKRRFPKILFLQCEQNNAL